MSKITQNLNYYFDNYPIFKDNETLRIGLSLEDISKVCFFNRNNLVELIHQQKDYLIHAALIVENDINMINSSLYPKDVDVILDAVFCK